MSAWVYRARAMNRDPKALCAQVGISSMSRPQSGTRTVIRRAIPTDAPVLAALGARTFAEAFAHLYPARDLQSFLDSAYSLAATAGLLADPACATWLVEADGQAVG